jgi:peptidoglycan/xylan/chitin deacetylase (PgdA/CDA1 family)
MGMHELLQKDPEIWDLFCRKEEYEPSIRDKYQRFPYYASACRSVFEPRASEYLMKHGFTVPYPEGKPFAVCLTHDVDLVYASTLDKGVVRMKQAARGRFRESVTSIRQVFSKKHPNTNFEDIMNLEEQYNARSSFYFLALDPADQDYFYPVEDLHQELGSIQDRGFEVGLHGGHQGYRDLTKLKQEKTRLEKITGRTVTGCRNHYLNFIVPDTWELIKDAGFVYDCSFGYADCTGFRNGMCHPFRPYNLNTGRSIDILEIPQIIMDDSLSDLYMRLDSDTAWDITRRLIDTVAGCHGVITLLWHNTTLFGEQRTFYEKILQYCAGKQAWMTSGEQIAAWWKLHVSD